MTIAPAKSLLTSAALKLRARVIGIALWAAFALFATAILVRGDDSKSSDAGTKTSTSDSASRANPLRRSDRSEAADDAPSFQPTVQSDAPSFLSDPPMPLFPVRPAQYLAAPSNNQPPGIFDQLPPRPAFSKAGGEEIVHGVPNPSDKYPSQYPSEDDGSADEANPNCDPNHPGMLGDQQQFQPLPGSNPPSMFQPEHYPRYLGYGDPLVGTSWLNRPFHVDFFAGDMIGDDAIDRVIGQEAGFFTGGRLGWDYDYYWGVESRLGIAWMSLFDSRHPLTHLGVGNIIVWDMSLLYYPWGDSRWRPFFLLGTGIQQLDAYGQEPRIYQGTLFELPFGGGLKYRFNEWLIFRFDVIDNLAFGSGSLDTMHNVSFSGGLEYRFGGHRRTYWPWNPNPKH